MTNNFSNAIYQSPKTLSYLAIGGLAAVAATEVGSFFLGVGQLIKPDAMFAENEPLWIFLQALLAIVHFLFYLFTAIFFLIWLNRANKNLAPLRASYVEYSSGWAVGWWFVPFANLVKPLNVVQEVWRESDADFDPNLNFLSNSVSTPNILYAWWVFWIISNIASNISSRMFDATDIKSLELTGYVFIVESALTIVAAILAIKVVQGITNNQEERFSKLGSYSGGFQEPPPPPSFA